MENRIAEQLYAGAFTELAQINPAQQLLGSIEQPGQWANGLLDSQRARAALQNKWWSRIQRDIDPQYLSGPNRISFQLFEYTSRLGNLHLPFACHQFPANPVDGLHLTPILYLLNRQPAQSVSDLESYVAMINQTAAMIEEMTADIRSCQDQGMVPPRSLISSVIEQIRSICKGSPFELSARQNLLMEDFHNKLNQQGLVEHERSRLLNLVAAALADRLSPAYRKLEDYLTVLATDSRTSADIWQLPDTESFYLQQLYYLTSIQLAPDQIHAFALGEVARLQSQIEELSRQGGATPLAKNPFYPDSMEGRQAYLSQSVEIIAEAPEKAAALTSRQSTVDLVIKAVEPFREVTASATSYYPPASTGSQPGILYVNLADMQLLAKNQMQARIYHDTIPGLHLLYSVEISADRLPNQRYQGFNPSFQLGWAAYMEETARFAGFYSDHQSVIGQLSMDRDRTCSAVIDTGIFWKHWTEAQASNYLTTASCGNAKQNLQRVLSNPGLSVAHLVGKQQIQDLRDHAMEILGDAFDFRTYHDYLLDTGPLPWYLLEEAVDAWIAEAPDSAPKTN